MASGPTSKRNAIKKSTTAHVAQTPQATHNGPTTGPQAPHDGPTPIHKVRIPDEQWNALADYAKRHGISTSAALRVALGEFLRSAR